MNLCLLLLPLVQRGYEKQTIELCEKVEDILGDPLFADRQPQDLPGILLAGLDSSSIELPEKLHLAASLRSFAWWCGLELAPDAHARIGAFVRAAFEEETRGLSALARPITAIRPVHNLFVGELVSPLHSPSRGAVDYARALSTVPGVEHINIRHAGVIRPAMLDHMREALTGRGVSVDLLSVQDPDFLQAMIGAGGGVNHVWCDDALALHLTTANQLGPTLMFTCGDTPPLQRADVYWFFRDADYMGATWRACGVPEAMVENYVACDAGPNDDRLRPTRRISKADLGGGADGVLLATVGTRLGIDLDEPFVTGMESTLKANPAAHWMVVGSLPDYLRDACRSVFGPQFSHRPFEPDLPSLMTAVDVFVNPFRAGGGDSAMRALTGGAVVLARGDIGDVAALVPSEHRQPDAQSFFARLNDLIADAGFRGGWASVQSAKAAVLADQTRFAANLDGMISLACDRWNRRLFGDPSLSAPIRRSA